MPIFSQDLHSDLLRDHYLVNLLSSCDRGICIASLFQERRKKILKKQAISAKAQATVTPGISQQNSLYSKRLLSIFSSLLNSRSSKSRNLKLLLQINMLCNFVYNSLARLIHLLCYIVKNMLDVTVQTVAISGTSKLYIESEICS